MFGEIIDANSSDKKLADLRLQKIGFVFQVGPLLHSLQLWPQRAAVLMAGETGSLRIDVFLMLMDQMRHSCRCRCCPPCLSLCFAQTFNLLATMSAFENVELPMVIRGKLSRNECKARALELLDSESRGLLRARSVWRVGSRGGRSEGSDTRMSTYGSVLTPSLSLCLPVSLVFLDCSWLSGWPAGPLRPSAQRAEWRRAAESVRTQFLHCRAAADAGSEPCASLGTSAHLENDACHMCVLLSLPERLPAPWPTSPSCCCSMSPQVRTTSRSAAAAAAGDEEGGVAAQSPSSEARGDSDSLTSLTLLPRCSVSTRRP